MLENSGFFREKKYCCWRIGWKRLRASAAAGVTSAWISGCHVNS